MHKSCRSQTILPGVETVSIFSDRSFPRHSHDEFGFGYILKGGQRSWSQRGMVEAQAGDTITVNPDEMHDGLGRQGEPRQWHMIFLTEEALSQLNDVHPKKAEFTLPVNRSKDAFLRTKKAFSVLQSEGNDRNEVEQVLMLALAQQLDRRQTDDPSVALNRSREVQIAIDMICQSWEIPLSLADLANATGTSRFQILRRFSREVGTTPYAFLTQHRLKRARDMILLGVPLAETAVACGFSDQSHLTRKFSRQYGVTPGSFARRATS
ncbi:MAG: AraC family transcriptional regulator [Pseudomonadota bacterium]